MANEEIEFDPFVREVVRVLDRLESGTAYFVVDTVSKDRTLELCRHQSAKDSRFVTIWAPENLNVVDAYMRGFRAAYDAGHEFIIEMDAGLSHDPSAVPLFLMALTDGNECAFGSRFMGGGSMTDSPLNRRFLSRFGTILSNALLGTSLHDMTSGYQGFRSHVVEKLIKFPLRSKAHFYQTEVRYLLRMHNYAEIPIHYRSPSPRVSREAVRNSLVVLYYYVFRRLVGRAEIIK